MSRSKLDPLALFHVVVGFVMVLLVVIARPAEGDPTVFMNIANQAANGLVAYRDYSIEYPPLALVAIDLPRLLGGTSPLTYDLIFMAISVLLTIATGAAVYWLALRRWSVETPENAALLFAGLCLAGAPLVFWRFDILPALLTALALIAYAAGRGTWSGLALGLGVVVKIYPAVLVPVFALAQLFERNWRRGALIVGGAALAVVAVMAETVLAAGSGAFSFLTYQQNRGVEIESVVGGIALLLSVLGQAPATLTFAFGSWQVSSAAIDWLTVPQLLLDAVLLVGLIGAALLSFSRDARATGRIQPATLIRYSLATLLVVVLLNKVLSPQYLVWLLPFAALLSARQSLLLLAIVVLSTLVYPLGFGSLIKLEAAPVVLLNVRNALIVVYFAWTAWPRAVANAAFVPGSERGYVRQTAD